MREPGLEARLRRQALLGDYWKFPVTPHHQVALERMEEALHGKAIVCYASPALHTQAALYERTESQNIVPASSFPPVSVLAGPDMVRGITTRQVYLELQTQSLS